MNKLISLTGQFVKNHGSTILTVFGSVGTVATAILASKATIKAIDILNSYEEEKTKKEIFKETWICYLPASLVGIATIGCIIGSNVVNKQIQASLASAYMLIDSSFNEYKDHLKKLYGEETHNNIIDSIVKEKAEEVYIYTQDFCGSSTLSFDTSNPDKIRTFYDLFSKRYFESTIARVIEAEYHFNRNFTMGGRNSINELYTFYGIEPIVGGDEIGWDSYYGDIYWVDFNHSITKLDDGMEICVIDIPWGPTPFAYED